ncbi:hypothetical protein [Catalinimonas alkaloidigena]|uniref:hypothetical protein n=1 Tax=Catalinimonas alkaloidigena TaxID=1075417 RepID=UPI000B7F4B97|nr:hypothetical protein [Catalinimonas alkaloidigena]
MNKNRLKNIILLGTALILTLLSVEFFEGYILDEPKRSDITGRYEVKTWDFGVEKNILELKENGTYSLDIPKFGLCEIGEYEYHYEHSGCRLGFKCGSKILCAGIENGIFGHKIKFFTNSDGDGILFEKTK